MWLVIDMQHKREGKMGCRPQNRHNCPFRISIPRFSLCLFRPKNGQGAFFQQWNMLAPLLLLCPERSPHFCLPSVVTLTSARPHKSLVMTPSFFFSFCVALPSFRDFFCYFFSGLTSHDIEGRRSVFFFFAARFGFFFVIVFVFFLSVFHFF